VQFPFLVMLSHYLKGERMTVSFNQDDESGGSKVRFAGKVARSKHALASDPEYWSEALTGTLPGTR
jgi:hypothetical protein